MSTKMKVVIIDDESDAIKVLTAQLARADMDIEITASFTEPEKGLNFEDWKQQDILFLDMEMPSMNGYEFLEKIGAVKPQVIFTTAHSEYAIGAFRRGAIDYLLKPISLAELNTALHAVASTSEKRQSKPHALEPGRIGVPTQQGFEIIHLAELIWLESSNNYTYLHMESEEKPHLISRTLRSFEKKLSDSGFARVNQSNIINLAFVKSFDRRNGNSVFLVNDKEFTVSQTYKDAFLEKFEDLML